ncbi:hypothetical protein KQX54_001747 [Cotesia glomerata]|uniref:Uncharacterized protein n=1 Tax=Cotesia glomerata TaxID=32391 RepID=A0AAV7ITX7_COTGL|nr:hypothetical protein KQX54_001747 [Cotesia glomerata]
MGEETEETEQTEECKQIYTREYEVLLLVERDQPCPAFTVITMRLMNPLRVLLPPLISPFNKRELLQERFFEHPLIALAQPPGLPSTWRVASPVMQHAREEPKQGLHYQTSQFDDR